MILGGFVHLVKVRNGLTVSWKEQGEERIVELMFVRVPYSVCQ
jgi:hypothetical protein